jgi:hypothetical protein
MNKDWRLMSQKETWFGVVRFYLKSVLGVERTTFGGYKATVRKRRQK